MMADEVYIEGLADLQRRLAELPNNIARNFMKSGVYAAAKIVEKAAKEKAPVYTGEPRDGHPPPGTLKRSIIAKSIPELSGMWEQTFKVTVRKGIKKNKGGKKNRKFDAFYASWVEYGHYYAPPGKHGEASRAKAMAKVRAGSKMVEKAFFVPAHPYMRPAWNETKGQVVDKFAEVVRQRLEDFYR